MGRSVITIDLVGSHGCDRKAQAGEALTRCDSPSCVDCTAAAFVAQLAQTSSITEATHAHWPDDPGPVDDLLGGTRKSGSF